MASACAVAVDVLRGRAVTANYASLGALRASQHLPSGTQRSSTFSHPSSLLGIGRTAGARLHPLRASSGDDKPPNPLTGTDFRIGELTKELTNVEDLGKRGEVYFVGQVALVVACAFPPDALNPLAQLSGVSLLALGLGLVYFGAQDLGSSLSPLPKPREGNTLRTTGIYAVCRHPMYSGLLSGGVGAALLDPSPARSLFVVALAALLNSKAALEEEELAKIHPSYDAYKQTAPRLVPDVPALVELVKERAGSSSG